MPIEGIAARSATSPGTRQKSKVGKVERATIQPEQNHLPDARIFPRPRRPLLLRGAAGSFTPPGLTRPA